MNIDIISQTTDPELTIANAASVCYDSKPKTLETARKMIKALIKSGHTATIEHASVTFLVHGISRAVSHEIVRHRIASYCQRSQRYVNEKTPSYEIPEEIQKNHDAMAIYT